MSDSTTIVRMCISMVRRVQNEYYGKRKTRKFTPTIITVSLRIGIVSYIAYETTNAIPVSL